MVFVQAVMVWSGDKIDVTRWIEDGELHGLGPPRLTMPPQLRRQVMEEIAKMNGLSADNSTKDQMGGNGNKQPE